MLCFNPSAAHDLSLSFVHQGASSVNLVNTLYSPSPSITDLSITHTYTHTQGKNCLGDSFTACKLSPAAYVFVSSAQREAQGMEKGRCVNESEHHLIHRWWELAVESIFIDRFIDPDSGIYHVFFQFTLSVFGSLKWTDIVKASSNKRNTKRIWFTPPPPPPPGSLLSVSANVGAFWSVSSSSLFSSHQTSPVAPRGPQQEVLSTMKLCVCLPLILHICSPYFPFFLSLLSLRGSSFSVKLCLCFSSSPSPHFNFCLFHT